MYECSTRVFPETEKKILCNTLQFPKVLKNGVKPLKIKYV